MGFHALVLLAVLPLLAIQAQQTLPNFRLPGTTRPINYTVEISTDLDSMTFTGAVTITLTANQDTNQIVMHAKDLNIMVLSVFNDTSTGHFVSSTYSEDNVTDFLTINVVETLRLNEIYTVLIVYNATIGEGNVGYYRAFYPNEFNNRTVPMAITHLEATNARRAFPCYDQPDHKARFVIRLTRNSNQITSSNMPLQSTITDQGRLIDVYQQTVVMSTYLIAFMVSEYGWLSVTQDLRTYTTFGRPELISRGDGNYSLTVAPQAIQRMENFTNYRYPIPKMDQVSVPNEYYKIGAMENYGMVTYRERYLMHNSQLSTAQERQSVATIISHEFAHQWFGNLVTPEWWKYIWLNEGFATYFEQYITSLIEPTWDLMQQFITTNVQAAFNDDAVESTRPMTREAESPTEIDNIYDTIVYEKAGSVIRMVEGFLGPEAFQQGLQTYLYNSSYGNVNPTILYSNWQSATTQVIHVANIMQSWETQAGYPVVNVQRFYNNFSALLTQERFYLNRATGSDTTIWHIPVNYFTLNTTVNTVSWLSGPQLALNGTLPTNSWVIFNNYRKGFYRVNYDETNWNLIINFLRQGNFSRISVENRAQLIDDAFNLARADRLNYTIAFELGTIISNETHYVPISTFTSVLSYLDKMATGNAHHNSLRAYGRHVLEGIYNRTGFTINAADAHLVKLTKADVNTMLCHLEHSACRASSTTAFNAWINTPSVPIQPDMQSFVYCNGIRATNRTNWDTVLQRYNTSTEFPHKNRLATALGCVNDQAILTHLLLMLVEENSVFTQTDKLNALTSVYTNNGATGVNIVIDFLTTNFTLVNTRIGSASRIVSGIASRISTDSQLARFNQFVDSNNATLTVALGSSLRAAVDTAQYNVVWVNRTRTAFVNYFEWRERSAAASMLGSVFLLVVSVFLHIICKS